MKDVPSVLFRDHESAMRDAFHKGLPIPTHLQDEPDSAKLWRYWRFLHHKAGKVLPPPAATWLAVTAPASTIADDHAIDGYSSSFGVHDERLSGVRRTCSSGCEAQSAVALASHTEAEVYPSNRFSLCAPTFDALSFMEGLVNEMEERLRRED